MKKVVIAATLALFTGGAAVAADYCLNQCPVEQRDERDNCHGGCLTVYMIEGAFCSVLPTPMNAICHASNSNELARCMREC